MIDDDYIYQSKNPFNWRLFIFSLLLLSLIILGFSCTSVKKVQHSIKETFKLETAKSKDSAATVMKEITTKANENSEVSKTITIDFNHSIDTPIAFVSDLPVIIDDYITPEKVKIKTNKPSAVKIHANGDIELSEQPKSITVKENISKQKFDSTHSKETAIANLKETEKENSVSDKKEFQSSKKTFRFLSWWWLLALIPVGYFLNKKFNWV